MYVQYIYIYIYTYIRTYIYIYLCFVLSLWSFILFSRLLMIVITGGTNFWPFWVFCTSAFSRFLPILWTYPYLRYGIWMINKCIVKYLIDIFSDQRTININHIGIEPCKTCSVCRNLTSLPDWWHLSFFTLRIEFISFYEHHERQRRQYDYWYFLIISIAIQILALILLFLKSLLFISNNKICRPLWCKHRMASWRQVMHVFW